MSINTLIGFHSQLSGGHSLAAGFLSELLTIHLFWRCDCLNWEIRFDTHRVKTSALFSLLPGSAIFFLSNCEVQTKLLKFHFQELF